MLLGRGVEELALGLVVEEVDAGEGVEEELEGLVGELVGLLALEGEAEAEDLPAQHGGVEWVEWGTGQGRREVDHMASSCRMRAAPLVLKSPLVKVRNQRTLEFTASSFLVSSARAEPSICITECPMPTRHVVPQAFQDDRNEDGQRLVCSNLKREEELRQIFKRLTL